MAGEEKSSSESSVTQDQQAQQPPAVPPGYPQQPNGNPYPMYPPYYPYPPPADGAHPDPNAPGPYMMAFPPPPPGMMYAYPPPPGQAYAMPFPHGMALPAALVRPKRRQVKKACTNCATACKRCDEARPCERCVRYGVSETCVDGVRKERKKGIKRGPYKRKGKVNPDGVSDEAPFDGAAEDVDGQWQAGAGSPNANPSAAPQPMAPGFHDGYYPYAYPPYLALAAPPDGDGAASGNVAHPMPPHPFYPMHPGYPGYPPYAMGGYPPPMHPQAQVPTAPTAALAVEPSKAAAETNVDGADGQGRKKRGRSGRGDETSHRAKKAAKNGSDSVAPTKIRSGKGVKSKARNDDGDGGGSLESDGPGLNGVSADEQHVESVV